MSTRLRASRRLPITLVALVIASLFTLAPGAARPTLARDPETRLLPATGTAAVGATAITPGSVNRTSSRPWYGSSPC